MTLKFVLFYYFTICIFGFESIYGVSSEYFSGIMIISILLISTSLAMSAFADSIILENDCKRTTEECFIRLETLKGDPSRDCSIFSTIDRKCSIKTEVDTTKDQSHLDGSQLITITETERGTVVSWHGEKNSTKSGESTSLSAMSVWDRILPTQPIVKVKRSTEGVQTECICKPVQRQKRDEVPRVASVRQFMGQSTPAAAHEVKKVKEANGDPCKDGYRFASKYIGHDDTSVTRQITAGSLKNCAQLCKLAFMHKKPCISFAFNPSPFSKDTEDCLLRSETETTTEGGFEVFEKC